MNSQYYINDKTNSILKNSIRKNNRGFIATILYNEFTDLVVYNDISETTEKTDYESIVKNLDRVHSQLYSDKPFKTTLPCSGTKNCADYCKPDNNSLPDCFIITLYTEEGIPFLWEDAYDGVILIETQRRTECCGHKLIQDCCKYSYDCLAALLLQGDNGAFLWEDFSVILLEDQSMCDGIGCVCKDEIQMALLLTCGCPWSWENDEGVILLDKFDCPCSNCVVHGGQLNEEDISCECQCFNCGCCSTK